MPTIDISAGLLPPPTCYASEQERLDAYASALIGNLNTGAEWAYQQTAPGPVGLYWFRSDASGRPVEIFKYSSAAGDSDWVRMQSEVVFAGTSTGAASAYAVTNSPPYPSAASAYRTGQVYTFIANHVNTGASTLNVDGKGAKTITKDATAPLVANDILAGQIVSVVYDGVNFQLLTQKRDLSRQSLREFLWYDSPLVPVPAAGVLQAFPHNLKNPVTLAPLMPFSVRAVLVRTVAGPPAGFTNTVSGFGWVWPQGNEIDCLNFSAAGGAPFPALDLPAFKYLVDNANVYVQATYQNGIIFPGMLPVLNPMTDYSMKVYVTALNPLYLPP